MVVAEAEDVSLLELGGEAVLLAVAGPHLAARGHRPAVVVQPSATNRLIGEVVQSLRRPY